MIEIPFPFFPLGKVIIVVKGHPCTGKAQVAQRLGQWASCQVFYIDYFLETFSLEKSYKRLSPPSVEEAERIHRLALDALYTVALRHLEHSDVVVIKSRLSSTYELDLFIRMFNTYSRCDSLFLFIIDCGIQNEYKWRSQVEQFRLHSHEWYKIEGWEDIEKIKEDCIDSQAFDLYLNSRLKVKPLVKSLVCAPRVTRLVLDYFDDFNTSPGYFRLELTQNFKNALIHLLKRHAEDENRAKYKVRYVALFQLDHVRRYLLEKELDASRVRSQYLCSKENTNDGCCVFKYREELLGDEFEGSCCWVCEKKVVSGRPAYTCHFCILTLHKSCAETALDFTFPECIPGRNGNHFRYQDVLYTSFDEKCIACKSCNEKEEVSVDCQTCVFETHLRCGVLPTIINHDCHPLHFLSIQILCFVGKKACNACGEYQFGGGYVCHICNVFYDLVCIFLPEEVKQEHGGHEHVMKLMYSREGIIDQEDDHWCNGCYKEMDPQNWFYYCQECPYYVTHALHECVGSDRIEEAKSKGKVPIQQVRDKFKQDECLQGHGSTKLVLLLTRAWTKVRVNFRKD